MDHEANPKVATADQVGMPTSESRRGFLKLAALTGAVATVSGHRAFANGEIGYYAKDLPTTSSSICIGRS